MRNDEHNDANNNNYNNNDDDDDDYFMDPHNAATNANATDDNDDDDDGDTGNDHEDNLLDDQPSPAPLDSPLVAVAAAGGGAAAGGVMSTEDANGVGEDGDDVVVDDDDFFADAYDDHDSAASDSLGESLGNLQTTSAYLGTMGGAAVGAADAAALGSENSFNLSALLDADSEEGGQHSPPSVEGTSASESSDVAAAGAAGAGDVAAAAAAAGVAAGVAGAATERPSLPPRQRLTSPPLAAGGAVSEADAAGAADAGKSSDPTNGLATMAAKAAVVLGVKQLISWASKVWHEIDDDYSNPNIHDSFQHSASHALEMQESSRNLAMGYFYEGAA